ncbi:hypothetical protein DPMN_024829 [Dreissena polymorpha]|uniref:Saposin B-type domain-containing protein n=1 Tax=Dreissena polymorpha TaxID=45954 RepID=A0A9D4LPW5_DREPO|nr:hypothetical protein DPMN_024829 [Dreissena polymorpha]
MKIVLLVVFIGLSRGAPSADPGPGLCDVCHLLVGEIQEQVQGGQAKLAVLGIDKLVKQNRSSAAINATLEKFCNSLPGELGNLCRKIEPLILQGLTQGFDPKVACKFATLCSDSSPGDISILPCEECHSVIDAIGVSNTEEICGIQATCRGEVEQPKEKSLAPHPETDVKVIERTLCS